MRDTKALETFLRKNLEQTKELRVTATELMQIDFHKSGSVERAQNDILTAQKIQCEIEALLLLSNFELIDMGGRQ